MAVSEEVVTGSISHESVYAEMYSEMRRYRDYEFTSSTWYLAMLLAILGFLLLTRFGERGTRFGELIASGWSFRIAIMITALLVALSCSLLMAYSFKRYKHLREYVDTLEPEWKRRSFTPLKEGLINPRRIYHVTAWLLVIMIWLITWLPN